MSHGAGLHRIAADLPSSLARTAARPFRTEKERDTRPAWANAIPPPRRNPPQTQTNAIRSDEVDAISWGRPIENHAHQHVASAPEPIANDAPPLVDSRFITESSNQLLSEGGPEVSDLATVYPANEGEYLAGMGASIRILVDSASSNGRQGVLVYTVPPGLPGPPLHKHDFDELFYVLDGTITFSANGETFEGGPGTSVFAPGGVPHTFANKSGAPATYLLTFVPGGFEQFFRDAYAALKDSDPASIPGILGALQASTVSSTSAGRSGLDLAGRALPPTSALSLINIAIVHQAQSWKDFVGLAGCPLGALQCRVMPGRSSCQDLRSSRTPPRPSVRAFHP